MPVHKLRALAESAGFELRKSKHIRLTHNTYPDIQLGLSHANSAVSKLRLADALELVAHKMIESAAKSVSLQSSFCAASENRLADIRAQLPPYVTAELTQNGNVVLRDVQLPQLGVTLYSADQDRMIESYLRYTFGEEKRTLYPALKRLVTQYDAIVDFDSNGTLGDEIKHEVYGDEFTLKIPAYQEGGSSTALSDALESYKKKIEDKDLEHMLQRDALLTKPFVGETTITHPRERGIRHNHVHFTDPRIADLGIVFESFSNQRVVGDGSRGRISDDELARMAEEMKKAEDMMIPAKRAIAAVAIAVAIPVAALA